MMNEFVIPHYSGLMRSSFCHVQSQQISGLGIQTDTVKNKEEGLRQADSTTY